jgi:hypothetical protein
MEDPGELLRRELPNALRKDGAVQADDLSGVRLPDLPPAHSLPLGALKDSPPCSGEERVGKGFAHLGLSI